MKILSYNKEQIIRIFNDVHNNKYDYSLVEYLNVNTKVKIICPIHGIFEQLPSHHKRGIGCKKCFDKKVTLSNDDFINKSNLIHNNKYDYHLINYINAHTKIKIICPIHGIFEQTPNKHTSGRGCPFCHESKGENKIKNFLDNNKIKYINQKKFEGCKYKRDLKFDFYLIEKNICIEFDGDQHFEKYRFEKNDDRLKIRQLRDKIKSEYCLNNNIELVRIGSKDIKNIDTILSNYI